MAQQISTNSLTGERSTLDATHATPVGLLSADFRAAFAAFAAYLDHRRPITRADAVAGALEDLAALFAQAAADGIPVRNVVGHDPAQVAEALLENYTHAPRDAGARADLARTIDAIVAGRTSAGWPKAAHSTMEDRYPGAADFS
ncbi:DUF1048 domain-containing protein [Microbacterium hibisci]|uniref:DUF1048 domain-containing protein n=1 Tax=Microbacterium hibisci TaxID=2036000 RepID=UPI0019403C66|nr:DUF1048 domain-containing protein [Microbacterium hibisci]